MNKTLENVTETVGVVVDATGCLAIGCLAYLTFAFIVISFALTVLVGMLRFIFHF